MGTEADRVLVRVEVRRLLRLLVQEAQRQGCMEQVRRFPDVFVLFALLNPVICEAIEQEKVTLQDMGVWLNVLLDEGGQHEMGVV